MRRTTKISTPFASAFRSIAIVGSRNYPYPKRVRAVVRRLARVCAPETLIISGAGGRVDRTAIDEAELQGMHWMVFPANWDAYGKGVGPRRNQYIIDQADLLIAFWITPSAGTQDDVRRAQAKGIPIRLVEGR